MCSSLFFQSCGFASPHSYKICQLAFKNDLLLAKVALSVLKTSSGGRFGDQVVGKLLPGDGIALQEVDVVVNH